MPKEFVRLKLFRFSLKGKALDWIDKEVKANSLTTWAEVTSAFLKRFYSHRKTAEVRAKLQGFQQRHDESLYDAWERYKEYQSECPHHGIQRWLLLQTFYLGLSPTYKTSLDAGAGGPIMNKSEDEMEEIIEDVVQNYQTWQSEERDDPKKGTVYAVDHVKDLEKMVTKLSTQMEKLESAFVAKSSTHLLKARPR